MLTTLLFDAIQMSPFPWTANALVSPALASVEAPSGVRVLNVKESMQQSKLHVEHKHWPDFWCWLETLTGLHVLSSHRALDKTGAKHCVKYEHWQASHLEDVHSIGQTVACSTDCWLILGLSNSLTLY